MNNLPGYKIREVIYQGPNTIVYYANSEPELTPVILKTIKADYPTPKDLVQFQHEYSLTKSLDFPGIIKVERLINYQNKPILVLEDFGSQSLAKTFLSTTMEITKFLTLSIEIVNSLGYLHQNHVIHKDINPSNIVYNPETQQIKIIDFGISTVLSRENPTMKNANILEGTLAYMSPEQTGRMNRTLDYRTDFYSLGATFYQLLTNQLPFETNDPLELVHSHLAKQPISPHKINPEIPLKISEIIMKLLAKTAEERYQSAAGIKADLQSCLSQWQSQGKITDFQLGSQDISDRFSIPQKLYGREQEVDTLLTAFHRVTQGESEMILVAGYSGIGKSVLVQEIYKPITKQRGYFIVGKFDQYQRNIPYIAAIKAFQGLVKQLLTQTQAELEVWRNKLLTALGANGQVIIDVIPEVELIIGKQEPVPELPPTESQNRFNFVLQKFIKVFGDKDHPLALFLDDLQWADIPSLNLIQLLMTSPDIKYLFLIGAYRDNEVSPSHPLVSMIEEIKENQTNINHIFLDSLGLQDINRLISDTLNCSLEKAFPLAELMLAKTAGNPFFLNEFFKSIYTEKFLNFDYNNRSWKWDLAEIKSRNFTDNVVELMTNKIQKLDTNTQKVLQSAACIGNQFDTNILGLINAKTYKEIAEFLLEAAKEGLVLSLNNSYKVIGDGELTQSIESNYLEYKFVHDRIQQAAYSLIIDSEKPILHYKIGNLLLQNNSPDKQEEIIFDLVYQLNCGREIITDQEEKNNLARLNVIAGKKALSSSAYDPALNYFSIGLELLGLNSWENQYKFTLELYELAAEAAFLSHKFGEMDQFIDVVKERAVNLLDKIRIYQVQIEAFKSQNFQKESLDLALNVLEKLGINFPEKPKKRDNLWAFFKTKFGLFGRKIQDLVNLPEMTNNYKIAAMKILVNMFSPAYRTRPELVPLLTLEKVNLSVKYGNTSISPFAYANYGLILCGFLEDIDRGYKFGELAVDLLYHLNALVIESKTLLTVHVFIQHWKLHLKESIGPLLTAYQSGLQTGDLDYAGWSIYHYCHHSYLVGNELAKVEQDYAIYEQVIREIKQKSPGNYIRQGWQVVLNLIGESDTPWSFIGLVYNEEIELPLLGQNSAPDPTLVACLLIDKLPIYYLFDQLDTAWQNLDNIERYVVNIVATPLVPIFYFYDSLVRLAVYFDRSPSEQKQILTKVDSNQKKMKNWAGHAPMNHLHKFNLVEAEKYRVLGKPRLAIEYFESAIQLAKQHQYIQEEGLGNELIAKFYLDKGQTRLGKTYLLDARYCYQIWGANAKINHLDKKYANLLDDLPNISDESRLIRNTSYVTTMNAISSKKVLDFATVMQASQAISGEIVLGKLLSKLIELSIANAGAQKGFLILYNNDQLTIEVAAELDRDQVNILPSVPVNTNENLPMSIINYGIRTNQSVVLSDATQDGTFTTDPYIIAKQPKSVLCMPIVNQGKAIGLLYLENNLTTGAFTIDRLEVLRLLATQAAISIENALLYQTLEQKVEDRTAELATANREIVALNQRLKAENLRMSAELEVTKQLQAMILPKSQELELINGLDMAGFMEPADEVGGDYYDVLQYGELVKIGIGDVTGHGLESGVLMMMVQTAIRTLMVHEETDPVKLLSTVNRTIYDNVQRMNVEKSMTLALLDYKDGKLHLSGQHEEMIIVRSTGELEQIDTMGLGFPIGLASDIRDFVAPQEIELNSGDVVVLYTDGITEAEDINNVQYGLDQLCDLVKANYQLSAQEIREKIIESVRLHIGTQKVYDDITLLVFKKQ